ncbi:DUF2793 domain-containing protein [Paralimibaculum aggregatum]|uniref:DUF2793 domain-containing protein n=1 Tax=Paralimibaculum aggregatum TaxID=3036245 RepID=A0ABQ6LCZ8_9RHOB|nr:DUF2793 domain-containing protein [Limibaculum sp. NKW23]GMG81242.1 DUF2793 domain-containing protein [Limibaculum sp. NKW23]
MSETARFGLTLLEAAQAQKHVTVNEALARLDALAAFHVEEIGLAAPPAGPAEGTVWPVGSGAGGDWAGQDGRLAIRLNGGWDFAEARDGMRVWNAATGSLWLRSGGAWIEGGLAVGPGGAGLAARVAETELALAGASSSAPAAIPDKAVVIGVSARVTAAITGASGWQLGVPGAADRYGSGFGTAAGSWAEGVTGQPQAYYGGTPLLATALGGDFTGGTLRLAVHYLAISAPL